MAGAWSQRKAETDPGELPSSAVKTDDAAVPAFVVHAAPYMSALLGAAAARTVAERAGLPYLAVMSSGECVGVVSRAALDAAPPDALLIDCVDVPPVWIDAQATEAQARAMLRRMRVPCLLRRSAGQIVVWGLADGSLVAGSTSGERPTARALGEDGADTAAPPRGGG